MFLEEVKAFENEFQIETTQCLVTTQMLQTNAMKGRAQRIYEQFVKPNSAMEINIGGSLRNELACIFERNTKASGGNNADIDGNVFDEAKQSILRLLASDSLRRYLQKPGNHQLWKEFLQGYREGNILHNVISCGGSSELKAAVEKS